MSNEAKAAKEAEREAKKAAKEAEASSDTQPEAPAPEEPKAEEPKSEPAKSGELTAKGNIILNGRKLKAGDTFKADAKTAARLREVGAAE